MTFALYDPATGEASQLYLPEVGFEIIDGKLHRNWSLRILAARPDMLRRYAPTVKDAYAGRYIVPVRRVGLIEDLEPGESYGDPVYTTEGDPVVAVATHLPIPPDIPALRRMRKQAVDMQSGALIMAGGFPYKGDRWPLDDVMQTNLMWVMTALTAAVLTPDPAAAQAVTLAALPPWGNIDDTKTARFATVAEFAAFYNAAFVQVAAHRASGRALKSLIDAAQTFTEIDAVVDER